MFTVNWLYFDPLDQERVIGWGVYRKSPWHLVGVYLTEYIAREKAVSYGCDYLVSLGPYRIGSHDFRPFMSYI